MNISDTCFICKQPTDQMLMLSCVHDPCINCAASTLAEQVHIKGLTADVLFVSYRFISVRYAANKHNWTAQQHHSYSIYQRVLSKCHHRSKWPLTAAITTSQQKVEILAVRWAQPARKSNRLSPITKRLPITAKITMNSKFHIIASLAKSISAQNVPFMVTQPTIIGKHK